MRIDGVSKREDGDKKRRYEMRCDENRWGE